MAVNRICELLGIRYPIISAPMNWVTSAELVAAVSNAGGLGTLGPNAGATTVTTDANLTGERMREQIRKVKSLTKNPFAVNLNINPPSEDERDFAKRCIAVTLEEKVPAVVVSLGGPDVLTKVLHDNGIKVLHTVSTARHSKKAEEAGVDAIICEGYEGGGHKGTTELTTLCLIPEVANTVQVPIVAGGGIGDARGILAALVLGADGVYMGTRFMLTKESSSHPKVKEAILKTDKPPTVSIPKGTALLARDLRNQFTQTYLKLVASQPDPADVMKYLAEHSQNRAQALGDFEEGEICCGQVASLVNSITSVAEVFEEIKKGISPALAALQGKISEFS
jgi:NAD(P)H-dependent flavin oxidoreductase YrpB (nitropropane dioxygenase family)